MPSWPEPVNALGWIEEHRESFRPPSGARVLWRYDDMFALLLAGPNVRDDYHVNAGSETFYQLKGDLEVGIVDDEGAWRDIQVREGDVWCCPAGLPHQPRRPAGTYGMVIERLPRPDEESRFVWYCTKCRAVLHEVSQLGPSTGNVLDSVTGDEPWRTCARCGHRQQPPTST